MFANAAGVTGSQILRGDDAPLYHRGFIVCLSLVAGGLAFAIFQHVQYQWSNQRLERREREETGDPESHSSNVEEVQGHFRYTI